MASWRPYIDSAVNSGMCQGLSMHDLKGNPFVSSDGFRAVAAEVGAVTSCFANPHALEGKVLKISGKEYEFEAGKPNAEIQLSDGYGGEMRAGVIVAKCGNYVVVGMHDHKTKPSECRSAVEKIIFYLKQASSQGSGSSWQPYIDHAVTSWMVVKAGGIYAHPSGKMWACSRGFKAEEAEIALVAQNLADPEALAGSEIMVNGKGYVCTAAEPGKEIYCENGKTGVCFRLCGNNITGKFMAVAYHDDTVEPIACRMALVKVGEYFDARATGSS